MLHIKITGPGQTFSSEMYVIKYALESLGLRVNVYDEFNDGNTPYEEVQKWIKYKQDLYSTWPERQRTVVIETDHQPWGG